MGRVVFWLLVPTLLAMATLGLVAEEVRSEGTIIGRVVNQTLDGTPLPGWEVVLHVYSGQSQVDIAKTITDPKGNFRFERLEISPERMYMLSTRYEEVVYLSDPIALEGEVAVQAIALKVYEKTGDPSKLLVSNHHIIITPTSGGLWIREMLIVKNDFPYTYTGEEGLTLKLSLPVGAREVQLEADPSSENTRVVKDSLLVYEPILPEGQEIIYFYQLNPEGTSYKLSRKVDYPTQKLNVFLSMQGVTMRSDKLRTLDPLLVEGRQYLQLGKDDLSQGEVFDVLLDNLPGGRIDVKKMAMYSVTGLFVMVVLLYVLVRKRPGGILPGRGPNHAWLDYKGPGKGDRTMRRRLSGEQEGRQIPIEGRGRSFLMEERERMLQEIASLDDRYSEGGLEEGGYRSLRDQKKRRLVDLTLRMREGKRGT